MLPVLSLPPLLSTRSLIISKVNVLSCYIVFRSSSQTTTFETSTGSIVPLVAIFLCLLFLLPLSVSFSLVLSSLLEVNVLSCYTACLSSSQTVTLEKRIGSISTSWRTRGAQLLRKKVVVYSARHCTENNQSFGYIWTRVLCWETGYTSSSVTLRAWRKIMPSKDAEKQLCFEFRWWQQTKAYAVFRPTIAQMQRATTKKLTFSASVRAPCCPIK